MGSQCYCVSWYIPRQRVAANRGTKNSNGMTAWHITQATLKVDEGLFVGKLGLVVFAVFHAYSVVRSIAGHAAGRQKQSRF